MINLTERQKTALVAGVIGLAVGVGIGNSLPWYGSIEECELREQKGLPSDADHLVTRYCLEKFPAPYEAAEAPAAEAPAAEAY